MSGLERILRKQKVRRLGARARACSEHVTMAHRPASWRGDILGVEFLLQQTPLNRGVFVLVELLTDENWVFCEAKISTAEIEARTSLLGALEIEEGEAAVWEKPPNQNLTIHGYLC